MNIGQHRTRNERVPNRVPTALPELACSETHSPASALTPEDEAMLRDLERADVAFLDDLVDEVWGDVGSPFGNCRSDDHELEEETLEPEGEQSPCGMAERLAREIVSDWAWDLSDSGAGDALPRSGCWLHFPQRCWSSPDCDLLVKVLDLDAVACAMAWCGQPSAGVQMACSSLAYCHCASEAPFWATSRRLAFTEDCDSWMCLLALGLARHREPAPSRLWRMIDGVARTFRLERYDPENVLRILLGDFGARVLFDGLAERLDPAVLGACSWSEPELLEGFGASFIDYFREWSRAIASSGRRHLPDRLNSALQPAQAPGCRWQGVFSASESLVGCKLVRPAPGARLEPKETPMPKMTFYPLDNADTILIDLANKKKVLFDYADMRSESDDDKRIPLRETLWKDLKEAGRDGYDVFAVTHLDNDHTCKADEFFHLDHAKKYQEGDRAKIGTLWVPAGVIVESRNDLNPGARALQAEARYRLVKGDGIRVFSRPQVLKAWLEERGIRIEDRDHLITDAGNLAPEFSRDADGVEFFVHSPFAWRQDEDDVIDRNGNSLVMQATFSVNGVLTRAILGSDVDHMALTLIAKATKRHQRGSRLVWDIFKLPHHCSYLTLGPDRGEDKTEPVEEVRWLFEEQSRRGCVVVSTSKPIPEKGSEEDESTQPPHRQAANYYRDVVDGEGRDGEFKVTMEHPKKSSPKPLVIEIDGFGHRVKKDQIIGAAAVASTSAPRAGW
jgi:hypothetical protein